MDFLETVIITFNCGREETKPEVFARHLVGTLPTTAGGPHLIVLSLQEVAPIAYAFIGGSFLTSYLDKIRDAVALAARGWGGARYVPLLTRNVGMTAIMMFIREDRAGRARWLETAGVGVGVNEMGNKGAVAIRLGYALPDGQDTMEMTFVAAHLAPGEDGLERRNEDWGNIVSKLIFTEVPPKAGKPANGNNHAGGELEPLLPGFTDHGSKPASQMFTPTSYLFLAGDLNYRTSLTKPTAEDASTYPQPTPNPEDPLHYSKLLPKDQLRIEMLGGRTCHGFMESPIDFPPTYKYSDEQRDIIKAQEEAIAAGQQLAESAEDHWIWASRWPSWCDRVLFFDTPDWMQRTYPTAKIKIQKYTSLPLMSTSDHRPVVLALSIPMLAISAPADGTPQTDLRLKAPFPADDQWREQRAVARRKELATGFMSYLGWTWEGSGVLLAIVVGALGGWAAIWSMLEWS
jgi:hypothetical protein